MKRTNSKSKLLNNSWLAALGASWLLVATAAYATTQDGGAADGMNHHQAPSAQSHSAEGDAAEKSAAPKQVEREWRNSNWRFR